MKANKLNKTLLAAGVCASLVSLTSNAATGNWTVNFTTVPDVSIAQVAGGILSFGQDLKLAPSSTCTMAVSAVAHPGSIAGRIAAATATYTTAAAGTYQDMSGNCNTATKGTAGVYRITGAKGVTVGITVNGIAPGAGDFSYVPTGIVANYNKAADGDTFAAITTSGNNATGSAVLAADLDSSTVGGSPISGQTLMFLGGTVTVQNQLTAGLPVTQQFTVDVIYQ